MKKLLIIAILFVSCTKQKFNSCQYVGSRFVSVGGIETFALYQYDTSGITRHDTFQAEGHFRKWLIKDYRCQ